MRYLYLTFINIWLKSLSGIRSLIVASHQTCICSQKSLPITSVHFLFFNCACIYKMYAFTLTLFLVPARFFLSIASWIVVIIFTTLLAHFTLQSITVLRPIATKSSKLQASTNISLSKRFIFCKTALFSIYRRLCFPTFPDRRRSAVALIQTYLKVRNRRHDLTSSFHHRSAICVAFSTWAAQLSRTISSSGSKARYQHRTFYLNRKKTFFKTHLCALHSLFSIWIASFDKSPRLRFYTFTIGQCNCSSTVI